MTCILYIMHAVLLTLVFICEVLKFKQVNDVCKFLAFANLGP